MATVLVQELRFTAEQVFDIGEYEVHKQVQEAKEAAEQTHTNVTVDTWEDLAANEVGFSIRGEE